MFVLCREKFYFHKHMYSIEKNEKPTGNSNSKTSAIYRYPFTFAD